MKSTFFAFNVLVLALSGVAIHGAVGAVEPVQATLHQGVELLSRSAGLEPLTGSSRNELRLWVIESLTIRGPRGLIATENGSMQCTRKSEPYGTQLSDKLVCEDTTARTHAVNALSMLSDLARFDGKSFNCDIYDGSNVIVEGVFAGHLILFSVRNPGVCPGTATALVAKAYDRLNPR